jgi:hypothetical protein
MIYANACLRTFLAVGAMGALAVSTSFASTGEKTRGSAPMEKDTTPSKELIHRLFECDGIIAEEVQLPNQPELTVLLKYRKGNAKPMPVMFATWGTWPAPIAEKVAKMPRVVREPAPLDFDLPQGVYRELLLRGCVLVYFTPREMPWLPDRPHWVWPHPNQAGAEFFTQWCNIAPWDYGPVIDYLQTREDVRSDRIGYFGFSALAIIGAGLIAKEPRITCAVLYGGSGSFKTFWEGWRKSGIWEDKDDPHNWPETDEKLKTQDPVLYAKDIFPTALLMVNGGRDPIVPVESNNHFFEALYPHYAPDPGRLRYVVFKEAGHGWDPKWWDFMALDWLDRYLIQETPPPAQPRR